ncbi:MAG TPA: hypothetical protein VGO52_03120 [Hyphomonadaceae bacterium]|jgi:hypothetical protein|nr:hypothetical protein [Hyphomonadaceae bacterium]
MSLMAIILWALYPLSPWRRLQELERHLLHVIFKNLTDQRTIDWLCANPDDPEGVARIERCLEDLNAFTDFLIYQKARAILGLRPSRWVRPRPSPPQRRRTRTFSELYFRFETCALRFADVERLAERRLIPHHSFLSDRPITPAPTRRHARSRAALTRTSQKIRAHLNPRPTPQRP